MGDIGKSPAMLLDELARLDPPARRKLATILRQVSETFAEVPDGKTASHTLGVLAHLLDPGLISCMRTCANTVIAGQRAVAFRRFCFAQGAPSRKYDPDS